MLILLFKSGDLISAAPGPLLRPMPISLARKRWHSNPAQRGCLSSRIPRCLRPCRLARRMQREGEDDGTFKRGSCIRASPPKPPRSTCRAAERGDHRRNPGGDRRLSGAGFPRPAPDRRPACAISPPVSVRWRSAAPPRVPDGAGWRFRRSATSPTSTRTTMSARWTTGGGWTAWATGCGTPTRPTCRCRSCWACCTPVTLPPPSPFGNGETEFADMRAAYDALPQATQDGHRPAGRRTRRVLVARPDRLHRVSAGRARAVSAVAAAPGAPPSGHRPQEPLSVGARLPHHRLAGGRRAAAAARPQHPRDAAGSSSTATPGGSATW